MILRQIARSSRKESQVDTSNGTCRTYSCISEIRSRFIYVVQIYEHVRYVMLCVIFRVLSKNEIASTS
jgi:hypothetical protein